jgi:hypothetical protein
MEQLQGRTGDAWQDLSFVDRRDWRDSIADFGDFCRDAAQYPERVAALMTEAFDLVPRIDAELAAQWRTAGAIADLTPISVFLGDPKVLADLAWMMERPPENRCDWLIWAEKSAVRIVHADNWPARLQFWHLAKGCLEGALGHEPMR